MGYSHYFKHTEKFIPATYNTAPRTTYRNFSDKQWEALCEFTRVVIAIWEEKTGNKVCDAFGENEATINENQIFLNGDYSKDQAYETFGIVKTINEGEFNSGCVKTGAFGKIQEYDTVVVAILYYIKSFCTGVLNINSDGRGRVEHVSGIRLMLSAVNIIGN